MLNSWKKMGNFNLIQNSVEYPLNRYCIYTNSSPSKHINSIELCGYQNNDILIRITPTDTESYQTLTHLMLAAGFEGPTLAERNRCVIDLHPQELSKIHSFLSVFSKVEANLSFVIQDINDALQSSAIFITAQELLITEENRMSDERLIQDRMDKLVDRLEQALEPSTHSIEEVHVSPLPPPIVHQVRRPRVGINELNAINEGKAWIENTGKSVKHPRF